MVCEANVSSRYSQPSRCGDPRYGKGHGSTWSAGHWSRTRVALHHSIRRLPSSWQKSPLPTANLAGPEFPVPPRVPVDTAIALAPRSSRVAFVRALYLDLNMSTHSVPQLCYGEKVPTRVPRAKGRPLGTLGFQPFPDENDGVCLCKPR
jgi:hypothetical protein